MTAEEFLDTPEVGANAPKAQPTPVTFYSLGKDVGGPDETQDKWTNKGYSSKGPNLTPGVVAVNDKVHPLGTVFRDVESGNVFLAADRHGNDDPNVVDFYVPPESYRREKLTRDLEVIGRVDEVPGTAEGVREVLAQFGRVPQGPSAAESLGGRVENGGSKQAGQPIRKPNPGEGQALLDGETVTEQPEPVKPGPDGQGVNLNSPPARMTAEDFLDMEDAVPLPSQPATGRMSAEDFLDAPDETEAAVDDELTFWEKVKSRWNLGDDQALADQSAYLAATGQRRWEDVAPLLDVGEDERAKGGNAFSEAFLSAVQMVPAMARGMTSGMQEGVKFGAAGAAAAAVGGQLGPQAAAPEEVVTVPGAAVAGYSVGNIYGAGKYWYQQGTGSFYHTLRKEGIPHEVASQVSQVLGLPYAAIEYAQVTKLVPGLKDVAGKVVGATLRASLANLAKAKGREYVEQIGQETMQEVVGMAAEKLGETISGVEPSPDKIPAWERLWNTSTAAAKSLPFLMAPKAVTDTVSTVRNTKAVQAAGKPKMTAEEFLDSPEEAAMPENRAAPGGESVAVSTDWLAGENDPVKARESARDWWAENHPEPVEVPHAEFERPIIVGAQGVKHGTKGANRFEESASVPFLPELISKARKVATEPDRKGRNTIKAVHRLQVPVAFDGAAKTLNIVVRETTSGTLFYDHSYLKSESAGISGEQTLRPDSDQPAADSGESNAPRAGEVNPDGGYMPKPPGYRASPPPLPTEGEVFAPDVATAPRRVEWLKPETKGNPSLREIRRYLKRALDVPIRAGMRVSRGAQGALGVYRIRPETIRLRALNDVPTLLHEVGHFIHHMVFPVSGDRGRSHDFGGAFDAELMPMGAATSLPSYTPQMIRMEGVAEWFRHWVADPAAARMLAPKFSAHFDNAMRGNHPEMERILRTLQQKVRQYVAQPTKAKAMGMIQWEAEREGWTFSDWLKRQYTAWFHEMAPIERAVDKLGEFGLPEAQAVRVVNLANNYKGGWKSKADYDLTFEQTDLNGKGVGPSLKAILANVDDMKEFATYAALKRAMEKRGQGITTGFEDVMKAADFPDMMKGWEARFEKARLKLVRFTENQMQMLHQSGLLAADQLAGMRAANRDYVPFYRVHEALTGAGRKGGKGFANVSSGVMRMKGSDLEIINPIESVVKNTMLFRELAERNRVGLAFVDAVTATQGGGRIGETLLQPMKPTKVRHEEIATRLRELGITAPSGEVAYLGFTIYRAAKGANAADGTFEVMRDGKPKLFQVEDRELLRSLTLMDSLDAEVFNRFPWLKILRTFTSTLRKGATLTPEFIIRNPFRDQIIAGVYSNHGFVPFVDGFRGVLSMLGKDQVYQDWLKAGGKYGGLYDVEVNDSNSLLRAVAAQDRGALQQAAYFLNPLNVLKHLGAAAELMESGTRISEFRRAREQGLTPEAAAMASKDVTLNFSRAGYRGAVTNKMVAFFNAALQDMDKMARTFKDRPVSASLKAFGYITVPSMLVWWLGKDDEEIQSLPEWRKSFFWNINLREVTGQPFILTVPKPFLLGALFGTSAEKALDMVYHDDRNAVEKWFTAVMQNTLFRGDAGIATAFKPLLENMTNYSFFRDGPIESQAQQALSPALRYTPGTSVVARLVGERFNTSPMMIDNAVRGYLGGLGRYGTDAIDWFLVATDMVDMPPAPAADPRELPVIRALAVPEDESTEHVARFYRAMDRAENRIRDFKALGERMESAKQNEFWKSNNEELAFYDTQTAGAPMMTHLRRVRDDLAEINKAMLYTQNQRSWSPDFKREKLRELRWQRNELAKRAFVEFHRTDKAKAF